MFLLKGFITNAKFISNVAGVVAAHGEISTQSLTYSREKGLYTAPTVADLTLTSFLAVQDNVATQLTDQISLHVLTVARYIYDRSIARGSEIFADELLTDLITQQGSSAQNFNCGAIVNNGSVWMPEWVSWQNISVPSIAAANTIKIWFADASFSAQYDESQLVVVPPVTNLNSFFLPASDVQIMINALVPSETMIAIQAAKDGYPESVIRSETYNWVDPYNPAFKIPVTWNLLLYGIAGDNIDSVQDALVNYILANSTHTRDEWIVIFPDLFRRREFILMPLWTQYSVPNRTLEAGIYSPVTNLQSAVALTKQAIVGYPSLHIDNHIELMATPYKSLAIMTVGNPENTDSLFEVSQVFSDYIGLFSTSEDFNRMSLNTQGWVLMLAAMIPVAENVSEFSTVPTGMTKVTRDNILYVVKRYGANNYLMAAKSNFPLGA
jgi:hypothetical protein